MVMIDAELLTDIPGRTRTSIGAVVCISQADRRTRTFSAVLSSDAVIAIHGADGTAEIIDLAFAAARVGDHGRHGVLPLKRAMEWRIRPENEAKNGGRSQVTAPMSNQWVKAEVKPQLASQLAAQDTGQANQTRP